MAGANVQGSVGSPVLSGSAARAGTPRRRAVGTPAWDPFLIALSAYVVVSIGRIHQLIPSLAILKPAVLSGVAMLGFFLATRRPAAGWRDLNRTWRFLVVGLVAWYAMSVPLGVFPGLSFNWWKDVVIQSSALGIVIAIGARGPEDVRRLMAVFVLSTSFYSVMILRAFGLNLNERFGSLYSYDTNDFAQVVVCALPFALYLAMTARRHVVRAGYWLLALLCLVIIIKSGSRGGFLGLVAVGLVALLTWRALTTRMRLVAIAGAAAFLMAFGSDMFVERINSILRASEDYNVTSDTGRLRAWKRGMGYMLDYPLLGVGVGAFGVAEGTLSDLAVAARQAGRTNVRWMAPHNSFVEVGAEAGIPGFILFIGLTAFVVRSSFRLTRSRPTAGRIDGIAFMGGAVFLSIIGFYVTAFFLSQSYSAVLYFLVGIVGALGRAGFPGSPGAERS